MPRLPHDVAPAAGAPTTGASGAAEQGSDNGNGNGNGNGRPPPGDGTASVGPRELPGPSTRPALVVLGIALVVLLAGGIGAALTSSGSAAPPAAKSLPTARGATITAMPGRQTLAPIVTAGSPPDDILDAVALPKGATVKAGSATDNGIGLYDHSLSFSIGVSEQRVIDFFRAELKAFKWEIVSQGAPPHGAPGYRIVGQHPSSDGYEWEIGVTVASTTFGSGSGGASDTTPFTVRMFAVTDD
jgi:hypothetical protein